jgi:hypothetical protein
VRRGVPTAVYPEVDSIMSRRCLPPPPSGSGASSHLVQTAYARCRPSGARGRPTERREPDWAIG